MAGWRVGGASQREQRAAVWTAAAVQERGVVRANGAFARSSPASVLPTIVADQLPSRRAPGRRTSPFATPSRWLSLSITARDVHLAREHVDRDHSEMQRSDEQIRQRVTRDAYDAQTQWRPRSGQPFPAAAPLGLLPLSALPAITAPTTKITVAR